ncbi:MAG: hypothetical protein KDD56_07750 [Bdellovibrionales bacterium]|nr:hypothetical protein [Bdellovibrionales bacterium]
MYVLGMGCFHPDTIISNEFLENLGTGTNAEWIIEKIGIKERRSVLPLDYIEKTRNQDPTKAKDYAKYTTTDLAVRACEQAVERAGIQLSQVGMIVMNNCTPVATVPCEAERVAHELGLSCPAFEVFTACPVFALHIDFLSNFKKSVLPEYILCISTAALTTKVNYCDRTDGAIWGDGAAAWVVSTCKEGRLEVLQSFYTSDPTRCQAVIVDTHGYFHQDGRAVRDFSVRQTVRLIKQVQNNFDIDWDRDIFIGHQANKTMLDQICRNRKIPDSNHWHNVTYIGNQAGASAPAVLAGKWDSMQTGQHIVFAVVGAGLSWGSVVLKVN